MLFKKKNYTYYRYCYADNRNYILTEEQQVFSRISLAVSLEVTHMPGVSFIQSNVTIKAYLPIENLL